MTTPAWTEFPFCSIGRGNLIRSWQSLQIEAEFRIWRIQGDSNLWCRLKERRGLHPRRTHFSTWFEVVISTYVWGSSLGWRKNHWNDQAELFLELAQVGSNLFPPVGMETPPNIWKVTAELRKIVPQWVTQISSRVMAALSSPDKG